MFWKTWLALVASSVNLTLSLIDKASIVLIIISVTDRNKTCRTLVGLLIKIHKLAHVFDWYCKDCLYYFFFRKVHSCSLKYFFSLWYKLRKFFFDSYFVKVPILYLLVTPFVAIKCFLFFFPSQECFFFLRISVSHVCFCTVSTYFKYLLITSC